MTEEVSRMPQVRSEQAKVQSAPAGFPPAKGDGAPTGMTYSLQGLAVSFSWKHPTYFVGGDRQVGPAEQALRNPKSLPEQAALNMPVHAPTNQPVSDEVVEDAVGAPAAPAIQPETVELVMCAADPTELTDAEVDIGYLALYEELIPAVNKSAARQSGATVLNAAPDLVHLPVRAAKPEPALAPTVALMQELEPETELAPEERAESEVSVESVPAGPALLQADPVPGSAIVVGFPEVGLSTWGDPIPEQPRAEGWTYQKPDIAFLTEALGRAGPELTEDILEETAGKLEKVIRDFGVKGEVIHVHPGPVVTLYEFEPAPGIKSSRVIALTEDIARSMSAISARVAVIPGRNAIGIELPNELRETVYLRELLSSEDFEISKQKLPLCLGKTIGGEPVIADLARMPHLLVAGTTGSGKSVAINTMILSLLYRFTPEECRLIMVDPKMLELSVYDGIPHLLTPVVTDPKKAIIALRWAVREMEDRYKKMSKLGVRNIDGFNARVAEAKAKGEVITCTVQTGFGNVTGDLTYEEVMDLKALPYIVVIVDEMADLMMVAGKEIEGAIQRLAQMARAAGIHVILATQRPSVDVITGTIKANFPTRISFQVTSKIDSRTILGEMGAEQLLGQGDLLHMQGGGRIARVHGPFVSDEEVERVVAHLKRQAKPVYLEAVTAEDDEDEEIEESAVLDDDEAGQGSGELYDHAVAVVLRHRKASTSYIQRRLQIGYNRAASIMERMEKEGIVGPANHAGRREILIGTGGLDEDSSPLSARWG
jgi:DNA segregation ATPase FtsK/SpoIIIE, S-DNA-T family